ncbi:LysR family transcriptional regulator [Kribbella sp. NPDC051620]|uniref:LysR family transcriptional regulator n=1 Tax=Kribbella sp. NPDC051620 TaxID=3364120 RepID=UPI0037A93C8C
MELDLRHLRVICRVADTGSISKAAASLQVSQPSLTAQLRRIESAIGGELFQRDIRGVVATPLGQHVVVRARALLADLDDLVNTSSKYVGEASPLRLGSVSTVMFASWLSRLEQELAGRDIRTQVDPCGGLLTDLLAADVLDIAMLMVCEEAYAPPCPPGVHEQKMVDPEPALIIMAADHRLAGRSQVSLADLGDETWIVPPAGRRDGAIAAQRAACEAAGFTPNFRYDELGEHEAAQLIAAGRGIATCAPTIGPLPGTVVVPLADQALEFRRVLRWRPERVPADVVGTVHRAFTESYREVLASRIPNYPWWDSAPSGHPVVHEPAGGLETIRSSR